MAKQRIGSPLGVALVAAVLAGLVTALVLSFVLADDAEDAGPVLTLGPGGSTPENDLVGGAAPNFTFEALEGGDEVEFDEYRDGRPALINFFARSCVPCVTEMPDLEAVHQEFGDDVAFVGLSYQESVEDAQDLVDRTGVTYEIGRDPSGEIITAYEGFGLPTTIFVTADGTITNAYTRKMQPDEMQRELEALVT
jgi:cytochrome c biogenesis protein CcmG, thiol:disulfide interchange protein DsbE